MSRPRERILDNLESIYREAYDRAKEGWSGFFDRIAERLADA